MEGKSREQCKIRKRGNSSSSSSSIVQKYRFKRAILVGKRGSTTPVPSWLTASKSPTLAMPESNKCTQPPPSHITQTALGGKAKDVSVSARKLAATLWEINQIPSPKVNKEDKKELRSRDRISRLPHLLDPSYTPISERVEKSRGNSNRRKTSVGRKKHEYSDYNGGGMMDSVGNNVSLMEIESHGKSRTCGIKTRLKDVSNGLTTSKELLKVLSHIWNHDEHRSSGASLVSALRVEVERARIFVDQIMKDQRSKRDEIEYLLKHFEEEKAAWKSKERDRIRSAIACIAEELEVEKKLRRQTERLNKKLGIELAETKASLSKALKELEAEKRAKEILEQVCDELANGIGEDRAEVEKLKRESAKVKEEIEKEREMLQLADVLREERVQMKLSEAKYHFEEKNAAVEKLRNELEAYLREKIGKENGNASPNYERIKELEAYLKETQIGSYQNVEKEDIAAINGEILDGEDSADSDLHSIELNMDNFSRSYKWSYACEGNEIDKTKGIPADNDTKARKTSESIPRRSVSLQRRTSTDNEITERNLTGRNHERLDILCRERLAELGLISQAQEHKNDIERYQSVKSLRDQILSAPKRNPMQNFSSPTRRWGQALPLDEYSSDASSESSPVLQGDSLIPGMAAAGIEHEILAS